MSRAVLLRALPAVALVLAVAIPAQARHPTAEESPLIAEAEELLAEVDKHRTAYRKLRDQEEAKEGEDRTVVVLQMRKALMGFMRAIEKLVANVVKQHEH